MIPRSILLASFALLAALLAPQAAYATDWRAYQVMSGTIDEVDADSVQVVDGLVHFRYRNRFEDTPSDGDPFAHPVGAVADCEGRRRSDVVDGKFQLAAVFEKTQSAFQIDMACRLAGRAVSAEHLALDDAAVHAWSPYFHQAGTTMMIDRNSVRVRDGRVFFTYAVRGDVQSESDGVVDCAARQASDVVKGRFTLADVVERAAPGGQADLACELGGLRTTPRTAPAASQDWRVFETGPVSVMEVDMHSIVRDAGLVHFTYRTRITEGRSMPALEYPVDAVTDCAARRRSDVVFGKTQMADVEAGSRWARQVDLVCGATGEASAAR